MAFTGLYPNDWTSNGFQLVDLSTWFPIDSENNWTADPWLWFYFSRLKLKLGSGAIYGSN
jgi:hypothetical protein